MGSKVTVSNVVRTKHEWLIIKEKNSDQSIQLCQYRDRLSVPVFITETDAVLHDIERRNDVCRTLTIACRTEMTSDILPAAETYQSRNVDVVRLSCIRDT